jgi:hypothetical protein
MHDLWCISNGCCADLLGCFSSTAQDAVQWSREGLLDHIMEFIVTHDEVCCAARLPYHPWPSDTQVNLLVFFQPFSVVDWPSFRALLKFQRPGTGEADIPHRTMVAQRTLDTAERVKQPVKDRYQVLSFHPIGMDWMDIV